MERNKQYQIYEFNIMTWCVLLGARPKGSHHNQKPFWSSEFFSKFHRLFDHRRNFRLLEALLIIRSRVNWQKLFQLLKVCLIIT